MLKTKYVRECERCGDEVEVATQEEDAGFGSIAFGSHRTGVSSGRVICADCIKSLEDWWNDKPEKLPNEPPKRRRKAGAQQPPLPLEQGGPAAS